MIATSFATASQAQWYRDPACKWCARQPTLEDYYQCEDISYSGSDKHGSYKDCKITKSPPDRNGYVHNECQGTDKCGPKYFMIGNTRYYSVDLQKTCSTSLYIGHRDIVAANYKNGA